MKGHRGRTSPKTRRAEAERVGLQKLWEGLEGEERAGLFHSHRTVLNPEDYEKPLNGFKQKSGI